MTPVPVCLGCWRSVLGHMTEDAPPLLPEGQVATCSLCGRGTTYDIKVEPPKEGK